MLNFASITRTSQWESHLFAKMKKKIFLSLASYRRGGELYQNWIKLDTHFHWNFLYWKLPVYQFFSRSFQGFRAEIITFHLKSKIWHHEKRKKTRFFQFCFVARIRKMLSAFVCGSFKVIFWYLKYTDFKKMFFSDKIWNQKVLQINRLNSPVENSEKNYFQEIPRNTS